MESMVKKELFLWKKLLKKDFSLYTNQALFKLFYGKKRIGRRRTWPLKYIILKIK